MCTSLAVLLDTTGVHKERVLQKQIFFSAIICGHVYCGEWFVGRGDTNSCVIRYTKHGLCADCTVQINATHHDDNHVLLLKVLKKIWYLLVIQGVS